MLSIILTIHGLASQQAAGIEGMIIEIRLSRFMVQVAAFYGILGKSHATFKSSYTLSNIRMKY